MAKRSGKTSKTPRQPSPRRAAAIDAYTKAVGRQVADGRRGFGNPANQAAAQKAKGNKYEGPGG